MAEESKKIYTRDITEAIIYDFRNVLSKHGRTVEAPASIRELMYDELVDKIEFRIQDLCNAVKYGDNPEIVVGHFSGTI